MPNSGKVYCIQLKFAGEDRRLALRQEISFDAGQREELTLKLEKMESRSQQPWVWATLSLIENSPGVRAPDLAEQMGQPTKPFKARVRRLKELGLTESLKVGYQLSPRGVAFWRKCPHRP